MAGFIALRRGDMSNHLAVYFKKRRIEKGYQYGQLARLAGYKNVTGGSNKIQKFERDGIIHEELFWKLADALEIDIDIIEKLIKKDELESYHDQNEFLDSPIEMYLNIRVRRKYSKHLVLPMSVSTIQQAFVYAVWKAKSFNKQVVLTLSRRVSILFNEQGEFMNLFETKADHDIAFMPLKRTLKQSIELPPHEQWSKTMAMGKGVWILPYNGEICFVTRHERWLMNPTNQQQAVLSSKHISILNQLDVDKDIDLIRMIGVRAGLIRIRDYHNHISVQFYLEEENVSNILKQVVEAIPQITKDKFPYLEIHNLANDKKVCLHFSDLQSALNQNQSLNWTLPEKGERIEIKLLNVAVNRLLKEFPKEI